MTKRTTNRSGFTLTELLVVITVISMLAAISLGGLHAVQQSSNVDRTRRTIQKIHFLLMEKLEEYQTKRVDVGNTGTHTSQEIAIARVIAMHDLMRLEMPDRLGDVISEPIDHWKVINDGGSIYTGFYTPETNAPIRGPALRYANKIARAFNLSNTNQLRSLTEAQREELCGNMSAELLYMIIMSMPNASEQFAEYEIADTNGNNLREFVDAWGEPIRFLRWAPGLDAANSDIQKKVPSIDPSPFDPYGYYRAARYYIDNTEGDKDGYILYPLVFSAGPDKKHGVNVKGCPKGQNAYQYPGNPYRHPDNSENLLGDYNDEPDSAYGTKENYYDNITNHILEFGRGR